MCRELALCGRVVDHSCCFHSLLIFRKSKYRIAAVALGIAGVVLSLLGLIPFDYSRTGKTPVAYGQTIYVVGDSLSAVVPRGTFDGLSTGAKTWPVLLSERYGYDVVNLAVGGARLQQGLKQAERIEHEGSIVLLELGGNDMLDGVKPEPFEKELRELIDLLLKSHHKIIMFELPSFPLSKQYQVRNVQKKLAREYKFVLLPKKVITEVLGMPGGTTDGLHFSQEGHERMAKIVSGYLRKERGRYP